MNDLVIKETYETPGIKFSAKNGSLVIEGRSLPENSIKFYEPLLNALEDYSTNPADKTTVDFKLEYFNTGSSKCILTILRLLQNIHSVNENVTINWYHDEEDVEILETGEDYSRIVNIPFNIKVIPHLR